MSKTEVRKRNWCFTWNNPYPDEKVEDFQNVLRDNIAKYYIMGHETASTGTRHIQGYIDFINAKTMSALKKKYPKEIHWEARKGTWEQATTYCKKEGNFEEWGFPPKQGKRSDIDKVKEMVREKKDMSEIIQEVSSFQACKFAELAMKYQKVPVKWYDKKVYWFYGPTGTGKTRLALEEAGEEVWRSSCGSLKWFDGYDGQKHVLFDDFRASWCTFSHLLNLLDKYPVNVEIKGGFRMFMPDIIWITSATHPKDTYKLEKSSDKDGDVAQLLRRIDRILPFGDEPPDLM